VAGSLLSHLWNQVLARLIFRECGDDNTSCCRLAPAGVFYSFGRFAATACESHPAIAFGLRWKAMSYGHSMNKFWPRKEANAASPRTCDTFSQGRAEAVFSRQLTHSFAADDLHTGQQANAGFHARGCYATILIKRLFGDVREWLTMALAS
jgi:hypothetical protein